MAVDQSLVEQVPYFCQFWNEQSARLLAQKSSLYLMPILSLSASCYEDEKDKEQEEEKYPLEKKLRDEDEEVELEEEEEVAEEEEVEETEEEPIKEETEEEIEKEGKLAWSAMKGTTQLSKSQQSLQWQWQQDLKAIIKEEQENDEKEAIGR